jgi:hypothetical protein
LLRLRACRPHPTNRTSKSPASTCVPARTSTSAT